MDESDFDPEGALASRHDSVFDGPCSDGKLPEPIHNVPEEAGNSGVAGAGGRRRIAAAVVDHDPIRRAPVGSAHRERPFDRLIVSGMSHHIFGKPVPLPWRAIQRRPLRHPSPRRRMPG